MGTTVLVVMLVLSTAVAEGVCAVQDGDDIATDQKDRASNVPLSSLIKEPLRFSAFNMKVFGTTKFKKSNIVDYIIQIIKRYDIILLQEIRDSSESIIYELHKLLNTELASSERYDLIVSPRLGRSSSKEQYAFLYKPTKLEIQDEYVYDDAKGDVFEREPYVVWFRSKVTSIKDFAVIGIHVKPTDAINEINNLTKVYDDFLDRYDNKLKDVIFAGDFNADCSYVGKTKWGSVTFRSDDRFAWLIDDDADTTVAYSSCAYDRLVIAGEDMARAYVPGSASVFYFDSALGLDQETAKAVSDHYPIEMNLMPPLPVCKQRNNVGSIDDSVKMKGRIEL